MSEGGRGARATTAAYEAHAAYAANVCQLRSRVCRGLKKRLPNICSQRFESEIEKLSKLSGII